MYDYLLYYNGSSLYLLNFTFALRKSLPYYAPKNTTYVYFNWIYYTNGSWYVNVSISNYSPETVKSFNFDYIYRLDLKNFCVERTNLTFPTIPTKTKGTINGWKIMIPSKFLPSPDYGPLKAYFFLGVNPNITKPVNCCSSLAIPPHSKLPVYFLLEKNGQVKNVTLFYINATENLTGFWFPNNVKIVNVTVCEKANVNTSTKTVETNGQHTQQRRLPIQGKHKPPKKKASADRL